MGFSAKKLEAVVVELVRREPGVPHTKLLKMLYESDFAFYEDHLRHLTGARYVALPLGPVLDGYKRWFAQFIGTVLVVAAVGGPYDGQAYSLRGNPKCGLTDQELEVVERVSAQNRGKDGRAMIGELHRYSPWRVVWKGFPGERISYDLAPQRPDFPSRLDAPDNVLEALEHAEQSGLIHFDLLVAADNLSRELFDKTSQPIEFVIDRDWVSLLVESDERELEIAVSFDRKTNWRVFYSAKDEERRSGTVRNADGLDDLALWQIGENRWRSQDLTQGDSSTVIPA